MRYRIVSDRYNGYEVQIKAWYHLKWHQKGFSNTFSSLKEARRFARDERKVYEEGNTKSIPVKHEENPTHE